MKRFVGSVVAGVGVVALVVACSDDVGAARGGLVVTVDKDPTTQLDELKVEVTSGTRVLLQNDFHLASVPLPNTVSIVSNGDATATASIAISGWLGGLAVDRRDAVITQIPSDRVASLRIVLSSLCSPLLAKTGDPTVATSVCPGGQTCSTSGGTAQCASDSVNASTLPTYTPGSGTGSDGGEAADGSSDGGTPLGTGSDAGGGDASGAACTDGALQCNALQPQQCTGGQWQDQGSVCPYLCTGGACTGACAPGGTKCSGNAVETCGADFTWGAAVACPVDTPDCSGAGLCGVCVPGTMQCADGASTQTCTPDGQWAPATSCADATPFCDGAGVCGVCKTGSNRCVGDTTEVCDATGAWGAPTACTNACGVNGCTGVCSPGTVQCSLTVPTMQQTCNAMGAWVDDPIVAGTCSATCTPAQMRCSGTIPQTCNSTGSGWQNGAVMANQCGAVCTPGTNECDGTTTYNKTCQANGTWGPDVVTAGLCGAQCAPSSTRCVNPYLETCSATGLWPTTPSGTVTANQCGAVCTPGQKACLNSSQPGSFCTGPSSCWWVWTTEAIYDETCNSVGQWGPENQCTGECAGTNGMSYYNCDANNGGCIPNGAACSQK